MGARKILLTYLDSFNSTEDKYHKFLFKLKTFLDILIYRLFQITIHKFIVKEDLNLFVREKRDCLRNSK